MRKQKPEGSGGTGISRIEAPEGGNLMGEKFGPYDHLKGRKEGKDPVTEANQNEKATAKL